MVSPTMHPSEVFRLNVKSTWLLPLLLCVGMAACGGRKPGQPTASPPVHAAPVAQPAHQ